MSENWIYSWQWCFSNIIDSRRLKCNTADYVPIVVLGLSKGSSSSATPTSPTSFVAGRRNSHTASRINEKWANEWHRMSTERPIAWTRRNQKSTWKWRTTRPWRNPLRDLPEWLEEFENLVDDSVPEHRDAPASSSRNLSSERGKVVSGKHSIFLTCRRTEIATSTSEPKLQGLLAEKALVQSCHERKLWVIC